MLTYTTIFIASVILALIALVFYRVIMSSSKSVLSSKGPVSAITRDPNLQKGEASYTGRGTPAFAGRNSSVSPGRLAKTHPALPTENSEWGWVTGPKKATGVGNAGHCSLYNDADPVAPPDQHSGRLHREDKREAYGKAYKVTRKAVPNDSSTDDSGKPWGW